MIVFGLREVFAYELIWQPCDGSGPRRTGIVNPGETLIVPLVLFDRLTETMRPDARDAFDYMLRWFRCWAYSLV